MNTPGMFGPIEIRAGEEAQALLINGQVQGASTLEPSAGVVDPRLRGPGPVSASPYTLGWSAAALHNPTGKALMVGLGSGAGAVSMLFEFPGLQLDVVEIDPTLIEVCCRAFPLVRHYVDAGRLRIINADIADHLADESVAADFVLHDAYDGGKAMCVGGTDFYARLAEITPHIWVNIIGEPHTGSMLDEMLAMSRAGIPPQAVMQADHRLLSPFNEFVGGKRNWIVSTQETIPARLDSFVPYSGLDPQATKSPVVAATLEQVRQYWDAMVATESDADDLAELLACIDYQ